MTVPSVVRAPGHVRLGGSGGARLNLVRLSGARSGGPPPREVFPCNYHRSRPAICFVRPRVRPGAPKAKRCLRGMVGPQRHVIAWTFRSFASTDRRQELAQDAVLDPVRSTDAAASTCASTPASERSNDGLSSTVKISRHARVAHSRRSRNGWPPDTAPSRARPASRARTRRRSQSLDPRGRALGRAVVGWRSRTSAFCTSAVAPMRSAVPRASTACPVAWSWTPSAARQRAAPSNE
jgi:hypothetical protein